MGTQIFQKSRNHLKILGARNVTWIKFRRTKSSHPGDMAPEIFCSPAVCLLYIKCYGWRMMKWIWVNRFAFFALSRIMQGLLLPTYLVCGGFVQNLSFTVMTVRLNKRRAGQMQFFLRQKFRHHCWGGQKFVYYTVFGIFWAYNCPFRILLCLYLFEDTVSSTSKLNSIWYCREDIFFTMKVPSHIVCFSP
jgi:hypothetical protein